MSARKYPDNTELFRRMEERKASLSPEEKQRRSVAIFAWAMSPEMQAIRAKHREQMEGRRTA